MLPPESAGELDRCWRRRFEQCRTECWRYWPAEPLGSFGSFSPQPRRDPGNDGEGSGSCETRVPLGSPSAESVCVAVVHASAPASPHRQLETTSQTVPGHKGRRYFTATLPGEHALAEAKTTSRILADFWGTLHEDRCCATHKSLLAVGALDR